mmetsp:Transcript_39507/g.69373  ORF Transcript_39507/g.69373 Transcript_39507/m.69373 type:complete len:341 (+) Transcript_39507:311-1333(+)
MTRKVIIALYIHQQPPPRILGKVFGTHEPSRAMHQVGGLRKHGRETGWLCGSGVVGTRIVVGGPAEIVAVVGIFVAVVIVIVVLVHGLPVCIDGLYFLVVVTVVVVALIIPPGIATATATTATARAATPITPPSVASIPGSTRIGTISGGPRTRHASHQHPIRTAAAILRSHHIPHHFPCGGSSHGSHQCRVGITAHASHSSAHAAHSSTHSTAHAGMGGVTAKESHGAGGIRGAGFGIRHSSAAAAHSSSSHGRSTSTTSTSGTHAAGTVVHEETHGRGQIIPAHFQILPCHRGIGGAAKGQEFGDGIVGDFVGCHFVGFVFVFFWGVKWVNCVWTSCQ